MSDGDDIKIRLAYSGIRLTGSGKRLYTWVVVDEDNVPTDREYNFSKQLCRAGVGAVYSATTTADGQSVYSKGESRPLFIGQYVDRALRIEWQAEHGASEAQFKMEKAGADFDEDLEVVLAQLQQLMRGKNKHQRAALIGAVVSRMLPAGGLFG